MNTFRITFIDGRTIEIRLQAQGCHAIENQVFFANSTGDNILRMCFNLTIADAQKVPPAHPEAILPEVYPDDRSRIDITL